VYAHANAHAADNTLPAVAERYLLARSCCLDYARQIRSRAVHWHRTMDGLPVDQTTAEILSEYVLGLERSDLSPHTVRSYRTTLLSLVRFAGQGLMGQVRCPQYRELPVDAWTVAEIRLLVQFAGQLHGRLVGGVTRSIFWLAAIHSGYSTGLRIGDLRQTLASQIGPDRVAEILQHKTGKLAVVRFSAAAVEAIHEHGRDEVLPWQESEETFRLEFRWIVRLSGVRRGTFKWLRRAAGSYADLDGRGPELLGNTRAVFDRHYRVRQISAPMPPEPPEL